MLISLIFFPILLYLNNHSVFCTDDIYQSSNESVETTCITGTIFNLTLSQLNECVILVNWKFATYPLSDGSYTLHNIVPGKYIITISHPKLMFHDVFVVVTKIHGAFRVLASRYSPHYGREGKSWDRIAHQPIGLYVNDSEGISRFLRMDFSSISGIIALLMAIYSIVYTPTIVARRKLYASLYNIEWVSKRTGEAWAHVSKVAKEYFEDKFAKPNPIYEESNKIDWGTVNSVESYNDDMITPFMSEVLRIVRSAKT